uniref:Uncharacterized protein n=1 Tax=Zea mays TaxID=4577 RepID=C4J0P5_MAIZE|nr:unknown [Zea mays]
MPMCPSPPPPPPPPPPPTGPSPSCCPGSSATGAGKFMKCSPLGTLPRYTAAAAAAALPICGNVQIDSPLPPLEAAPPCGALLLGTIHTVPGIWLCVYPAICCWYCCCCCCISCSHRLFLDISAAAAAAAADGDGCTSRPTLPEKLSSRGDGDDDDEAGPSGGKPRPTTRSHASARPPNRAAALVGLGNKGAPRRWGGAENEEPEERREMLREVKLAGMVPVPVAAITAGSACCSSHSMVSPSVLCPSSRVSWNTRAAHSAGIRMRRPLPSTLVCRSLVELRLGAAFRTCAASPPAPDPFPLPPPADVPTAAELEHGCSSFFSRSWRGKLGRWPPPPPSPATSMVT